MEDRGTVIWRLAGTLSMLATCAVCAERVVVSGFGWIVGFCATNTGVEGVIERFVISCVMVAVTATKPAAASPIQTRFRHLKLVSDNPITLGFGMESKRNHMDLLSACDELPGELPGPVLQSAPNRIESLENETNLHLKSS